MYVCMYRRKYGHEFRHATQAENQSKEGLTAVCAQCIRKEGPRRLKKKTKGACSSAYVCYYRARVYFTCEDIGIFKLTPLPSGHGQPGKKKAK